MVNIDPTEVCQCQSLFLTLSVRFCQDCPSIAELSPGFDLGFALFLI